jgi:hypothetical protein
MRRPIYRIANNFIRERIFGLVDFRTLQLLILLLLLDLHGAEPNFLRSLERSLRAADENEIL